MKLALIDKAIDDCRIHLTNSNAFGTEIEAYLTRYLLILISASFEEEIEKIITKRISKANDRHIESFAKSSLQKTFRSIYTSEIAGLLGRFGPDYQTRFQFRLNAESVTVYNNIIRNRHITAHQSGSNITFKELVDSYEKAHSVLDAISETIFYENIYHSKEILDTFLR